MRPPRMRRPAHTRRSPQGDWGAEPLEARRLLATFTVNSFADVLSPPSGTVTLRSAIQAANTAPGPDTINLPFAGTYKIATIGNAIDNSAGEFAVADAGDLTIQNTGGGSVEIDGGGLNRVIDVDPAGATMPVTVTFTGLTITGGLSGDSYGGGILIHGAASVVLNQSDVAGNLAGLGGGGVATAAGSTGALTLNATDVSGNRAAGTGGGGIAGLGSGTVTINPQSVIAENTVLGAQGGGGVWVSGAPLSIVGAVIRDNRDVVVGVSPPGSGGGIANSGAGPVAIVGSIIEDNTSAADGGGYSDTGLATLTVRNSFVLDNTAGKSGGGMAAGGALVTMTNTTLAGNSSLSGNAADGGGGLYITGTGTTRLTDSTIDGNTAIVEGGGIFDYQATKLIVTGSTLAGNRALSGFGGGLNANLTSGDVSISNSLFRDNATADEGGGLYAQGGTQEVAASRFTGNAAEIGGAAYSLGTTSIFNSTFDANRTAFDGGLSLNPPAAAKDTLVNDTIDANTSSQDAGGLVFGSATGTLSMIDDTIDGNTAGAGAGGTGGLRQDVGTVVVQGTIIAGNTAAGAAADYTYAGGTLTDGGGNLLGSTAGDGGKFGSGTIVGDPKLGPLVNNGGQVAGAPADGQIVPTMALLPGSPAFGKGVAAGAPTADERGFGRPATPSIGAYEPQYASNASANQVFVENLFEVLLNRVADPGSLANAVSYLKGGGAGVTLVQILQGSAEFRGIEATQVFRRYLDRVPSPAEQGNVANYLATATPEQLAAFLVEQPEFFNDYGQSTDVFVEALYGDILGRTATTSERDGWVQLITNNGSRAGVAGIFLGLPTYLDLLVDADYPAYVGRMASPAEQANLAKMWPGFSSLDIQALLLGYGEAFARRT